MTAPGRRLPAVSPLVLIVAAAVIALGIFAIVVVATRYADEPQPAAAPSDAVATAIHSVPAAISPRNERTVYEVAGRLQDCVGPETIAWAGEISAGAADQPGLEDDVHRISGNIEDLRQHRFRDQVDVEFVSRDRVGEEALELSAGALASPNARVDEKILHLLRILPEGTSLRKVTRQAISSQVAGFYVPATKKLLAGRVAAGLEPLDELILAHELDHALTDAAVGLPALQELDPMESDRMLAHRTAVEGDATLAMVHYAVASFDPSEWTTLLSDPAAAGSVETGRLPGLLQKAFTFPYTEGLFFACDQFSRGGWAGVDRSLREPPVSSAQVLFPDRYLKGIPVVDAPDPATPQGWEHVRAGAFGAADLMWLAQEASGAPANQPGADVEKVRGWAGGELHAFSRDGAIAVQITLADGGIEAKPNEVVYELCDTLREVYTRRFDGARQISGDVPEIWGNGDSFAAVSCSEHTPRLAIAPDRGTAAALVSD